MGSCKSPNRAIVALTGLLPAILVAACGARAAAPAPSAHNDSASAVLASPEDYFSGSRMMRDVRWLSDPRRKGRGSFQPGGEQAATWVEKQLSDLGLEVLRQPVPGGAANIIGILNGSDEAVLVSAHYDHLGVVNGVVFPGADDDASGVAVLLAIARDRVAHPVAGRRTIVFAVFGAEEVGLAGSAAYVVAPVWPLERTVAVINFDMVGRRFFEAGADRAAAVGVVGLEASAAARAATAEAARRSGLDIVPAPARLVELFGYAYRTDDWWFRARGIAAYHFSTGFHADYHLPSDSADKIIPSQLARIAATAAGLLTYIANE